MAYSVRKLTLKIAGAAILASLSVIMQTLPPLFVTPWFMRIDLVAVPWVLCWLLFGFDAALLSLLISVPLVGVLGPFAGGWVGATMKSVASIWMFTIPALIVWKMGGTRSLISDKRVLALASVGAIAVRVVVTAFFNFYFALPVFFNMTPEGIVEFFNVFRSPVGVSLGVVGLGAFIAEVAFWNIVQGIIDIYVAYVVGFLVQRRIALGAQR